MYITCTWYLCHCMSLAWISQFICDFNISNIHFYCCAIPATPLRTKLEDVMICYYVIFLSISTNRFLETHFHESFCVFVFFALHWNRGTCVSADTLLVQCIYLNTCLQTTSNIQSSVTISLSRCNVVLNIKI